MIELVVGLGNPGAQYEKTRHNIGFMVLDKIAEKLNLSWKSGFEGEYCQADNDGVQFKLLKPLTYMNLSGQSVGAICRYYKIPFENILVVHDELDFPFGTLKLRKNGSAGGHNGIKSIIQHAGTQEFGRVRMGIAGISRSAMRGHTADYVLAPFTKIETDSMDDFLENGVQAVFDSISGLNKAMLVHNKK